jgi:Skp family chaperone for outer membrane proteins
MNFRRSLPIAALILVAGLSALPVTTARAADELEGKPVSGVCFLSREAVFGQAKVGEAASQRLNQLAEQARSQLTTQRAPLDADLKSFQEKAASLTEQQRVSQGAALKQRVDAFQAQAGELSQRVQLTRAKAMENIGKQTQPIVNSLYKSHQCGLLLNRDAVLAGNMTNDLTAGVVQGLDRKITTISFNLEPLPSGTGK